MLKHNKARSGLGEIIVEMLKHGIGVVVQELTSLFSEIWNNKEVPDDWHHSIIFKLPKKGNLINVESGGQGWQIRQIWRILCQNCSDDSTEVMKGVTSTPEVFGNKHSFVLTFFATNTVYVNCKRCKP